MAAKDIDGIQRLLSEDFVLDYVHADASQETPISAEGTRLFWPAWFAAFTESDFEGTRTIVAAEVVVTQWIFTGTHDGRLEPLTFDPPLEPTGRRYGSAAPLSTTSATASSSAKPCIWTSLH